MSKLEPEQFRGKVIDIKRLPDSAHGIPQFELTVHRDEILTIRTARNMPVNYNVNTDLLNAWSMFSMTGTERKAITDIKPIDDLPKPEEEASASYGKRSVEDQQITE